MGDSGGDSASIKNEFVVDMERRASTIGIVDGRPIANVIFLFVGGGIHDVELESKGKFFEENTGEERRGSGVVWIRSHELEKSVVEP